MNEVLVQIEGAVRQREASEGRLHHFVADATHELRTPLTALRGYTELCRQGGLPDKPALDAELTGTAPIVGDRGRLRQVIDNLLATRESTRWWAP